MKQDPFFNARYIMYQKPADPKEAFTEEEWNETVSLLYPPKKNKYVPENVETITKPDEKVSVNNSPELVEIDPKFHLYHSIDKVYLKPLTVVNIMFRVRQPAKRFREQGMLKTVCYLKTPKDFALFRVMKDCLKQTITKRIGYEANLAEVDYHLKSVEEMAINLNFSGYSDKLFDFIEEYLDILIECSLKGFDPD